MHTVYNATLLWQLDVCIFRISPEMVLTLHTEFENLLCGFNYDLHYTADYELVFIQLSKNQF